MGYKKAMFILFITVIITILLLKNNIDFHEGVVHLKSDNKEFKKKPEHSIESTILHREKEVYNYVLPSNG